MEELDKLLAELRGTDITKLSSEEYKAYKEKHARVQVLMNELYEIKRG